jgi:hypothetical protein
MAAVAPMAMLFVRSLGGVSHHPDERVLLEDVAVGLLVLVRYLDLLAGRIAPAGGFAGQARTWESREWTSSARPAAAPGGRTL